MWVNRCCEAIAVLSRQGPAPEVMDPWEKGAVRWQARFCAGSTRPSRRWAPSAEQEDRVAGEPVLDHVVVADDVRQRGIGVGPRGGLGGLDPRVAGGERLRDPPPAPGPA